MTKSLRLIQAIIYLQNTLIDQTIQVIGIQFEDGSGNKFNYQLSNNSKWIFADLTGKI